MRFLPEINHKSQNLEVGTFNEVEQLKHVTPSLSKNIQIPIAPKLTEALFQDSSITGNQKVISVEYQPLTVGIKNYQKNVIN